MSDQRSDDWFHQRLGRFTASVVHDLMGAKGLGDTGRSLAFEKAVEIFFGRDESWDVESWDMKRGNNLEPEAFEAFKKIMARRFIEVKKAAFFPNGDNSGSSPDGLVGKDAIVEIKCPRPNKFFRLVKDGEKAIESSHITQMQKQMHDTNSTHCHYFNYIIWNDSPMFHEIVVQANTEYQNRIEERIAEAVIIRDQYVKELRNNIQFKLA